MDIQSTELELRPLMLASLDGDAEAHRMLLTRLSTRLRAYFRGRLGRSDRGVTQAEDLVQEVLLAIHTQRHTYDRSQLLTPWVFAIARYKFLDYLRRTKASVRDVPIDRAGDLVTRDDFDAVDSAFDLERLLAGLSPKARQAIQDVKLKGLSVKEAAQRSGMSESAVKVTIHRALKTLARTIAREGQT